MPNGRSVNASGSVPFLCLPLVLEHQAKRIPDAPAIFAVGRVCAATLDASDSRLDEVKAALNEYQRAGYQLGITAQFGLLCAALPLRNESRRR
jgi:hypothetical protein